MTSEFLASFTHAPKGYKPTLEWFAAYNAVGGRIAALFPRRASPACWEIGEMIEAPNLVTVEDFSRTRNMALPSLYEEVIPMK